MPRRKIHIDVGELQEAITKLEATKLFSSPHTMYQAIAETPWARALGATAIMFYLRVKEVNVDPDNPVIKMRAKPVRRVKPRDPNDQSSPARVKGLTFPGLDILIDVFRGRGIEITGVEWLVASSQKSYDENRAIRLAWSDLRDKLGLPKPVKKSGAPMGEDLAQEGMPPSEVDSGITVTEEMPDGQIVLPQTDLDTTAVEMRVAEAFQSDPELASSTEAPVPTKVVPIPVTVRPVQPRPMPVRSSVPPRPMPVVSHGGKQQLLNSDGTLKQP